MASNHEVNLTVKAISVCIYSNSIQFIKHFLEAMKTPMFFLTSVVPKVPKIRLQFGYNSI